MLTQTKNTVPAGFKRQYKLRNQIGTVTTIAWSPDGQLLACAMDNWNIQIWDTGTGRLSQLLEDHEDAVNCLSWSPDAKMLASGSEDGYVRLWQRSATKFVSTRKWKTSEVSSLSWSRDGNTLAIATTDSTIRLLDITSKTYRNKINDVSSRTNCLSWSPTGHYLASGSSDKYIYLRDPKNGMAMRTLRGHSGEVYGLAWSPDGTLLASGSEDRTIRLWDGKTGRQKRLLEGHTHSVNSLMFSPDGSFLVSKSNTGVIRLWRCDTWDVVAVLDELTYGPIFLPALSFHPNQLKLATLGPDISTVSIWDLDAGTILGARPSIMSIHYTNAKIVLLGDSGVGKSGLGLVLSGQQFSPTDSTHGRHIWTFENTEIDIDEERKETRELLLWDLAGQPGYRLIHQLHLNEVTVALIIFDARDELDPFSGIYHWDRALKQAQRLQEGTNQPIKKFLIAARVDRGGVPVSRGRIDALVKDLQFDGFFETSAKEGWGIPLLRQSISSSVDWSILPKVSSNELFQKIKQFIFNEKEAARILSNRNDLYHTFLIANKNLQDTEDLRAQFETCIGRVESRGLIRRLSFGNFILLQPELLDAYASALIIAAKDEPDGLGSISEQHAKIGNFRIPTSERVQDSSQEILLLISTIEDLLRHELALREPANDDVYLVFPSQLTRERPDLPDPEEKSVFFGFEGSIINIYATLVVRLSHSGNFKKKEFWRNAATFSAQPKGICGIILTEAEEGRGELTLFFDQEVIAEIRYQFEEYVRFHLLRRAIPDSVYRKRTFSCTKCNEAVTDRQVKRRIELGHNFINCPICDSKISLLDGIERFNTKSTSFIAEMNLSADTLRDSEVALIIKQGQVAADDKNLHLRELLTIKSRRLQILEINHANFGISTRPEVLMEIDTLKQEIDKLNSQIDKLEKSN